VLSENTIKWHTTKAIQAKLGTRGGTLGTVSWLLRHHLV